MTIIKNTERKKEEKQKKIRESREKRMEECTKAWQESDLIVHWEQRFKDFLSYFSKENDSNKILSGKHKKGQKN